jgi:hypothetical protein
MTHSVLRRRRDPVVAPAANAVATPTWPDGKALVDRRGGWRDGAILRRAGRPRATTGFNSPLVSTDVARVIPTPTVVVMIVGEMA